MRLSVRSCAFLLPGVFLACSFGSSSSSGSGGCSGPAIADGRRPSDVKGAPPDDGNAGAPTSPAPTGQKWKPVATDEGCGRSGVRWVLVDEICGDGEGTDDPQSLTAPMFRDGAAIGDHLFAVDASHLWSLDLAKPIGQIARSALVTGLGQPLAVDRRGGELVLAAGQEGLVLVDTTNPAAPLRSRSLALPGAAFDVQVVGDKAFVAMGGAGLAEIDLASATPMLKHAWPLSGFSASVTTRGGYAFVASCSTFRVVDLATGGVVAQTWVPKAVVGQRLVAPAKKVTLVGDVAFVAAGRYGAVAIDVSAPTSPRLIGNCTKLDDESFYASGVRANASSIFVAGGEWGVLPLDAKNPAAACPTSMVVATPEAVAPSCETKPPWEVVPWEQLWAPPPPRKDPVQVLPVGDRLYAFGDARRIGTRAVDVREATSALTLLDRWDEPRALLGIAAMGDRIVAVGPKGGVFRTDAAGKLARSPSPDDALLKASTGVALLDDGRWVAMDAATVRVEGGSSPLGGGVPIALSTRGTKVAIATRTQLDVLDVATGTKSTHQLTRPARLPLSIALDASSVTYAAPEWPTAENALSGPLDPHGVFDDDDILDASLWRTRLPRRLFVPSAQGMVEIAGVGPSVGLVLHGPGGPKKTPLFPITYAAAASDGSHVYLVGLDRSLYRSYLVSVSLEGAAPKVVSLESFTGAAAGVAFANGRVFVADADGIIRVYTTGPEGAAVPAPALSLEVSP